MKQTTRNTTWRGVLALLGGLPLSGVAADAQHGAALYQERCTACHSLDYNGVGPMHRGVYGRKAGSVPGFAYSDAVRRSGVVWSEDTLSRWLSDPQQFIPGQRMGFRVADAADRADLIAYLKQLSPAASSSASPPPVASTPR